LRYKTCIVIFGVLGVSVIAQITFVLLFQYDLYDSLSGLIQQLKQEGFARFFAFSKSEIDPLLRKFEFVMDIWVVINIALLFVGGIFAFME
jgi:hypothetical protein